MIVIISDNVGLPTSEHFKGCLGSQCFVFPYEFQNQLFSANRIPTRISIRITLIAYKINVFQIFQSMNIVHLPVYLGLL